MLNGTNRNSMDKNYDYLKRCLSEISGTIDNLLPGKNPQILDFLEDWTQTQFHKLQLVKDHCNNIIINGNDKNKQREDALFIFDSGFTIISFSGTENFFCETDPNSIKSLNLLDLIEEQDHPKLKALFDRATLSAENTSAELRLKSNTSIRNKCTLEIDMASGNPSGNRYVAKLRFSEPVTNKLLDYQTLILDNLPGIDIYLFDTDYKYLFAGGREKERFELSNVQFIGNSIFNVLESKAVRLIYPFVTKALQGVKNEGEIRYRDEIYFLKAVPVEDINKRIIAAILFSQNITNNKELEKQLKGGREEALKADRLKSIFIANISHEIRTPLSAIIGFTEQLKKTTLQSDQEKFVNLINKSSDHLLYLVTEIVYLFKLGMGKIYLEKSTFSIKDLLNEVNDIFRKEASAKNLCLEITCEGEFPGTLVGDSFRLRQILMNLLTNAIKFTDNGTVSMQCSIKRETKKMIEVVFQVSDTGTGISRSDQKVIFNAFEQGSKLNSGSRGGAGLGLGICKNLTELLGGTITVKSKPHVGSVFKVTLPFDKTAPEISLPPAEIEYNLKTNSNLLAGKKILLADDDEAHLILAEHILASWKADYLLVDNGQKAIDSLAKHKFDIALIDIHMPVKNGLDVIAWLRSDNVGINSKMPVIFITANVLKIDLQQYLKAGFDGYLIKPFRENELYKKLCNILLTATEDYKEPVMHEPSVPLNGRKDLFNVQDLLEKANGNRSFFEKMINSFISNAVNLKDVLVNDPGLNNIKTIGEKAHKSIPSFKYFGLSYLAGQLEIIEEKSLRSIDHKGLAEVIRGSIPLIVDIIDQAKASLR